MGAPKGNEFWKMRSKHGRDKIFESPEILWEAACEYFEWVDENPLLGAEVVKSGINAGQIFEVPYMRAYTQKGLCLFLNITEQAWRIYSTEHEDFFEVTSRVNAIIYNQKFTGAAANLLNANIIARDLGLSDKSENETTHHIDAETWAQAFRSKKKT